MCCVLTTLGLLGPRAGILIWYLIDPHRWTLTFPHTALTPLLGSLFLPWTTLVYVAVAPRGLLGFDWFLLAFAFVLDIFSWTSGLYGNRRRAPGYPY
jgi:hypothetical protein